MHNRLALAALLLTACAGLRAQFPTDPDGTAKLMVFTGQVSVLKDGTAWALNLGDSVRPQQIVVTGPDGYAQFKVADGSTFEVFANSKVVFRANQGDWRDLMEVWLGKVRVKIEHFGGLPNNNRVRTPSAVISVRGTVFDVEVEDVTDTTLVVDEEGSVSVRHLLKPSEKVLNPGEFVRVYKDQALVKQIDKGGIMRRALRTTADVIYQVAVEEAKQGPSVGHTTTTPVPPPASKGPTNPPPPPPPPLP
ncbi:MAG: FecR domain-containing protein [Bryobacteraceae bacterium]|jgi:hypothetical protein